VAGSVDGFFALDALLRDDVDLFACNADIPNRVKAALGIHDPNAGDDDVVLVILLRHFESPFILLF
jgi:hypothetical protein